MVYEKKYKFFIYLLDKSTTILIELKNKIYESIHKTKIIVLKTI